ncbi:MAG: 1-deoxy-D-xylulose-5-phosphate reductoisomerase [Pseudomonadales bacterium]
MSAAVKQVTVLGSTGSIGVSTLDVIARHPEDFKVFALTANTNVEGLAEQVRRFNPRYAVLRDHAAAQQLQQLLRGEAIDTEVLAGDEALAQVAADGQVDYVMAAIVGAAGLLPTLAAVNAGKRTLLANKEALVMCGSLFMEAVQRSGAELLPIDSEHNAVYQCLPAQHRDGLAPIGVRRVILTASGGPFRDKPLQEFASITPEQACAHPNWSMGQKISVDSATMMNKGLELIEACWLFNTSHDKVDVLVHRQSVIHSMVEYVDGSVLAQMGNPDMRIPIAYGLSWPERTDSGVSSLDLTQVARLDFEPLDEDKFPCLPLAANAIAAGGTVPVALNAANEVAVQAFLDHQLPFTGIYQLVDSVLQKYASVRPDSIDTVLSEDVRARELARQLLR